MSQEIELKLALGPDGPESLRRHPLLAALPVRISRLGNTYFDTPDGALERARMALRLRRVDDRVLQTVKTRGQGGGGLSTRGEWEWPVPGPGLDLEGLAALPPAALGDEVLAQLAPRFTTDFRRETREIDYAGSRIELALDEGEILAGEHRAGIRELELELKAGGTDALWQLAEVLAALVPLRPSDTSKAARGSALLTGRWTLPGGNGAADRLHRAVVAMDALADTGEPAWREAAREALVSLTAQAPEARELTLGLDAPDWPTQAFGRVAVGLARRLPGDVDLA
ncbi:MAG: CYTH domain-containing protein [Halomonas sp.]